MHIQSYFRCLAVVAAFGLLASGCGKIEERGKAGVGSTGPAAVAANDGWWCNEHGVPEGECGLCDQKVAAVFKSKGDWCREHDRPETQCFLCHPELKARFATQYEARYGKAPPEPSGAEHSNDSDDHDEEKQG